MQGEQVQISAMGLIGHYFRFTKNTGSAADPAAGSKDSSSRVREGNN
jgi:hypothetical protein